MGEPTRPVMLTVSEARFILEAIDDYLSDAWRDDELVLGMVTADKVRRTAEALGA